MGSHIQGCSYHDINRYFVDMKGSNIAFVQGHQGWDITGACNRENQISGMILLKAK